jgi:hypothetical protein
MDPEIVLDDLLKALQHLEYQQCRGSNAESLTKALVAALYVGGHFQRVQKFLHEQRDLPRKLSSRRLFRTEPPTAGCRCRQNTV